MSTYDTPQDAYQHAEKLADETRELLLDMQEELSPFAASVEKVILDPQYDRRHDPEKYEQQLDRINRAVSDGVFLVEDDVEDVEALHEDLQEYEKQLRTLNSELEPAVEQQRHQVEAAKRRLTFVPVQAEGDEEKIQAAEDLLGVAGQGIEAVENTLYGAQFIDFALERGPIDDPLLFERIELARESNYQNSRGWRSRLPFR